MPKTVCLVHAKTLKNAKYFLKLMMKVSEEHYSHTLLVPVYGTGQGSSNSPYLWLFVSDVIFKVQSKYAHGAHYCDPGKTLSLSIYVIGFVDDINQFVNNLCDPQLSSSIIIENLKQDINLFGGLLRSSGGRLEPSKCSYTMLTWKFDNDGFPYPDSSTYPSLLITDCHNDVVANIKYLQPSTEYKYLGHTKTMLDTSTTISSIASLLNLYQF